MKKTDVRNDKKTSKKLSKTTNSFEKKNDVRNYEKTTKEQSFLTIKRRLKLRKLMKTKKTTTKRRKRRQNDENDKFLRKNSFFSSLSSRQALVEEFCFSLVRNRRFLILFFRQKTIKALTC